ncbi:MAG: hypothetical protein R3B84_19110 [Zavarzinella sp.]
MAYFLGSLFPIVLLITGIVLLIKGIAEPSSNLSTAGAILLGAVLISFSLRPVAKHPGTGN